METIEQWKPIQGYEGLYEVSNKGRVKSLGNGGKNQYSNKEIYKVPIKLSNGYLRVNLCKDGKIKSYLVHRLVANAFIPNPDNLEQVNHKDENKHNNNVENLCWCSAKENSNYGTRNERISSSLTNHEKFSTIIKCFNLETNKITYYSSIHEASRYFKVNPSIIWQSMYKSKTPYHKRYIFEEIKRARN